MIAFAALIVITHHAFAVDDQRQTIFEIVTAAGNGRRHMPQNRLEERRVADGGSGFSISTASMLFSITSLIVVVKNNSMGFALRSKAVAGVRCPGDGSGFHELQLSRA